MKKINYINPTNIDGISNESVKAYFSVLYCEIIQPKTGAKVQRTGLLSKTHPIIGVANLMPMGAIDKSLKKRWEEIDKETDEIIRRAKNAPLQDRPIIMDNLVSALSLYDKIVKNMTEDPDEAVATCYPSGEKITLDVSRDPMGLRGVKAIVSRVMGEWRTFFVWAENTHYIYNIVEAEKHAAIQEPQPTKQQEPQRELKDILPKELNTDEALAIFKKGVEADLIEITPNGLKWKKTKQLLAYFAEKMSNKFHLSRKLDKDGNETIDWRTFETIFAERKGSLKQAKQNWMRIYTNFRPTDCEKVDAIL